MNTKFHASAENRTPNVGGKETGNSANNNNGVTLYSAGLRLSGPMTFTPESGITLINYTTTGSVRVSERRPKSPVAEPLYGDIIPYEFTSPFHMQVSPHGQKFRIQCRIDAKDFLALPGKSLCEKMSYLLTQGAVKTFLSSLSEEERQQLKDDSTESIFKKLFNNN